MTTDQLDHIKNVCDKNGLVFKRFDVHHYRVLRPQIKKRVDFWTNGTCIGLNGKTQRNLSHEQILTELNKLRTLNTNTNVISNKLVGERHPRNKRLIKVVGSRRFYIKEWMGDKHD